MSVIKFLPVVSVKRFLSLRTEVSAIWAKVDHFVYSHANVFVPKLDFKNYKKLTDTDHDQTGNICMSYLRIQFTREVN